MEKLFSHLVYEIQDIGVRMNLSKEPICTLVAGFVSEELAHDFIKSQNAINRKKYKIKEIK